MKVSDSYPQEILYSLLWLTPLSQQINRIFLLAMFHSCVRLPEAKIVDISITLAVILSVNYGSMNQYHFPAKLDGVVG